MGLLQERGFAGGTTLEYSAGAIRSAGGLKTAIEESVAAIAAWAVICLAVFFGILFIGR